MKYLHHQPITKAVTMKQSVVFISILGALAVGSIALASDDDCDVPLSLWQSRATLQTYAESHGWVVRRIKIDDGCFEVYAYDTEGRRIEIKVDPSTFALVEFEYQDGYRPPPGEEIVLLPFVPPNRATPGQ